MTATAAYASKVSAASNSSDDAVLSASDVEMDVHEGAKDDTTHSKKAIDMPPMPAKGGFFGLRRGKDSTDADTDADADALPRKQFNRPEPPSWLKRPFANLAFEWFTPLLWNVR